MTSQIGSILYLASHSFCCSNAATRQCFLKGIVELVGKRKSMYYTLLVGSLCPFCHCNTLVWRITLSWGRTNPRSASPFTMACSTLCKQPKQSRVVARTGFRALAWHQRVFVGSACCCRAPARRPTDLGDCRKEYIKSSPQILLYSQGGVGGDYSDKFQKV